MLKKLINHLEFQKSLKAHKQPSAAPSYVDQSEKLQTGIDQNIERLKTILGKSDDLIFREFFFGTGTQTKGMLCFIDGLGNKQFILDYVERSLMVDIHMIHSSGMPENTGNDFESVKKNVLSIAEANEIDNFDGALRGILAGSTCLLIDGSAKGLVISAKGGEHRAISAPENEVTVRGARESFVETLRVNTSLLRRIIRNQNLTFEPLTVGRQTHTNICIAYINGIVNTHVLDEVRRRLNYVDIDAVLESGYIEQLIEDHPLSPFATVGNSERPDKVAAKLLEGRVAILCDGTPVVLTVPYLFIEALQVPEDYYSRPFQVNMLRLLRLLGFIITLTLPALYVALTTFHQEMLPNVLLFTFASAREGIPFPALVEALISETIYQLLRESGIRMPRAVGSAVSIVGTLVIGDAAVNAGIMGAPMVIITAFSAITSYILPSVYDSIILFKFSLILLAGTLGIYGLVVGLVLILAHMCWLHSFGVPYMATVADAMPGDQKDSIFRFPLWMMDKRPKSITWRDERRQAADQMPVSGLK